MDVLIKNMELPKNCFKCKLSVSSFTDKPRLRCAFRAELMDAENICRDARPKGCPLVEVVPVEHGKVYPPNAKFWVEVEASK